jgi:hypothetical protein
MLRPGTWRPAAAIYEASSRSVASTIAASAGRLLAIRQHPIDQTANGKATPDVQSGVAFSAIQ